MSRKKQRPEKPLAGSPSREASATSPIQPARQLFPPIAPATPQKWLLAGAILMLSIWLAYLLVMVIIK
jgi:hypothetical protein